MPKILDKKIQREARRYKVDEEDLRIAVNVINYEATNNIFDADLRREDIKHLSRDLWTAALRVQEYIKEYIY